MRIRILSRASSLARLQAALVERALTRTGTSPEIERVTRTASGDQDQTSPLWKLPDKGAFTADLSKALLAGYADVAVHSFKDLPVEMPAGTRIAGALARADARDVVLIKRTVVDRQPPSLHLLSSSPRRAWLLGDVLPRLLPWRVSEVVTVPVRGNIETRLRKLIQGDEHGLVMAKAALDRLLGFGPPFETDAETIRELLAHCRFMVMPMREFPWAPAQGAIAIEIAESRADLEDLLQPVVCAATLRAVDAERQVLSEHGGGCHQALGAAIIEMEYGRVVSVRARDNATNIWELRGARPSFPRAAADRVWPAPGLDHAADRRTVTANQPTADGYWVSRAEALPESWPMSPDTFVWAAGTRTWERLAARGVWVHGCADGLGEDEQPPITLLAGRSLTWIRLTHAGAPSSDGLATYAVEAQLPDDLPTRTHFYWTSGDLFSRALERWPSLRNAWHASGPGRTRQTIAKELGSTERFGVWLDRASWEKDICL